MMNLLRWGMWILAWPLLGLRYRVTVRGLDEVRGLRQALILPNHPAYVDPPLVLRALWPALRPRPMLSASAMSHPMVAWMPPLLDAVKVPDLEQASTQARQQTQAAIDTLVQSLKQGDNAILWPSGHLSPDGLEHLASSRSLAEIIRRVPEARIVLVRTEGLWGSRFSYAATGEHPSLVDGLLKGIGLLVANLLVFMPRRRVTITVHPLDRDELPEMARDRINRFLEDWYNGSEAPKPVYVPYHFLLGPRQREFPPLAQRQAVESRDIRPQTRKLVQDAFAEKFGRPIPDDQQDSEVELDALGLDSLDRMELTLLIEQRSGFSTPQVPRNLGDLYTLAQGLADTGPPPVADPAWFKPRTAGARLELLGSTIPESLVRRALLQPKDIVAADDLSGTLTYERFLVGALAMSRQLAKIPSRSVAVMLPASVASDLVLIALHLAGKLPVMINWTTGQANIQHAMQVMQTNHIVTSRRFMDRLGIPIEGVQFVHLEDVRKRIGKVSLLGTLLRVKLAGGSILRSIPPTQPDQPAVVLFTSGSEKAPKAVPLTHANILGNLRSVIGSFDLSAEDRLLGFLPPFHSFGISVTTLFPLLAGMRVVHHPDPTAAGALAAKITAYKPTLVCGTPTFVGYILDRVGTGGEVDVSSVRLWVVGAEKCPPRVFEKVRRLTPDASLVEGYGITECSPLISANRQDRNKPGTIGLPLPGVEVIIVDHDTLAPLPRGRQGMILVHGDNVFPGYIGHDGPAPFHEHEGKRWYVTGDLGVMDEEGFITFAGRLKRFIKAGGEMISLPAIEEPLAIEYPPGDDGPRVAVEGIETDHGRHIVLFATFDIELAQANALLASRGLAGVMRLDAVTRVEAIPMLGTGKTDYKALRAMVQADVPA